MNKTSKNILMLSLFGFSSVALAQSNSGIVCEDKIIAGQVVKRCYYGTKPTYSPTPSPTINTPLPTLPSRSAPPPPSYPTPTNPSGGGVPTSSGFPTYPDGQVFNGTTYTYDPGSRLNPPAINCNTTANQIIRWQDQQLWPWIPRGQVVAIEHDVVNYPLRFTPDRPPRFHWGIVETAQNTFGADVEVSVSPCPGDFMAHVKYGPACQKHYTALGGPINVVIGSLSSTNSGANYRIDNTTCELPGGLSKYYYNIRQVKMGYDGVSFIPLAPGATPEWSCPENCQAVVMLSR